MTKTGPATARRASGEETPSNCPERESRCSHPRNTAASPCTCSPHRRTTTTGNSRHGWATTSSRDNRPHTSSYRSQALGFIQPHCTISVWPPPSNALCGALCHRLAMQKSKDHRQAVAEKRRHRILDSTLSSPNVFHVPHLLVRIAFCLNVHCFSVEVCWCCGVVVWWLCVGRGATVVSHFGDTALWPCGRVSSRECASVCACPCAYAPPVRTRSSEIRSASVSAYACTRVCLPAHERACAHVSESVPVLRARKKNLETHS